MQTIMTKYLGPTNTKGSRIKAMQSYGVKQVTIDFDYSLNDEGNHALAAQMLLNRLGWRGEWRMGGTDKGYVFVNVDDHNSPKIVAAQYRRD